VKKLLVLLLSLLLLLPAVSLGEGETRSVEFDDFVLTVSSNDLLQTGEEAGSSNLFVLFPDYDEAADSHPNILARWTAQTINAMSDAEVLDFCNGDMQSGIDSMTAAGVTVTNEQLHRAERDGETGAITVLYTLDIDVAALGLDMKTTVCMGVRYVPLGEKGTYYFTIGCETLEEAETLLACLDRNMTIKK